MSSAIVLVPSALDNGRNTNVTGLKRLDTRHCLSSIKGKACAQFTLTGSSQSITDILKVIERAMLLLGLTIAIKQFHSRWSLDAPREG